jgi:hypothetical protein
VATPAQQKLRAAATGADDGMVTHRIRIGCAADVDEAIVDWLKQAYRQA